jgi:alpha-tubulin suppressor-like RCC1 family protein
MKGTTKGRLFPTRNNKLHSLFPLGVVDVSAGANFTAVVTYTGRVYRYVVRCYMLRVFCCLFSGC